MTTVVQLESIQWSSLPDVDRVEPVSDRDGAVLAELKAVLVRHGATDRFGVCLLHRHFDLADDECLMESTDVEQRISVLNVEKGPPRRRKFPRCGGSARPSRPSRHASSTVGFTTGRTGGTTSTGITSRRPRPRPRDREWQWQWQWQENLAGVGFRPRSRCLFRCITRWTLVPFEIPPVERWGQLVG